MPPSFRGVDASVATRILGRRVTMSVSGDTNLANARLAPFLSRRLVGRQLDDGRNEIDRTGTICSVEGNTMEELEDRFAGD